MTLTTLLIENFRGIKHLEVAFDETMTVLVGENNSGKTTILDAVRLVMQQLRSKRGLVFDAHDFHLKDTHADPSTADPICLTLTFEESTPWPDTIVAALSRLRIIQVKDDKNLIRLRVTAQHDTITKDFQQDWQFLDLAGNILTNADGRALAELQKYISYFYLSALRDAAKHFDAKGPYWRPFLKSSTLSPEERADIETLLQEANEKIIASHTSFNTARTKLRQIQGVVPVSADNLVSIDALPSRIFDMLAKTQVSLSTATGARLPVDRHGEGTQSLAVLMLFNAFLETWSEGSPIIALEEPEAHLHPSAVRALWGLIERLPGQKIISTHSGEMLSEVPVASLRRLHRTASGIKINSIPASTFDRKQSRQFDFHVRMTRGELLFARCWLLVEGESEVIALAETAKLLNLDLHRSGVACIPHRSSGLTTFLKAANAMGIPWLVFSDDDQGGKKMQDHTRNELNGVPESERLIVLPQDDIEQYLCSVGFGFVFEGYLTSELRKKLTVPSSDPSYWKQLTKAIDVGRHSKPEAILQVMDELRNHNGLMPALFEAAVKKAITLAEAG